RTASPKARLTTGAVAPALVISTSVKTDSCTGVLSSAAIRVFRSTNTRWKISNASTRPRNGVLLPARCNVSIRWVFSTTGAIRRRRRRRWPRRSALIRVRPWPQIPSNSKNRHGTRQAESRQPAGHHHDRFTFFDNMFIEQPLLSDLEHLFGRL